MAAEHAFDLDYVAKPIEFPSMQPQPVRKESKPPELRRVPRPRVDRKQLERTNNIKVLKAFVVAALAIVLLGVFCNSFAARTQSRHALDAANAKLEIQQDAHAVLENELIKLVSAQNIDRIAMKHLGLVKMTGADEDYLDLSTENQVLVSQNKSAQKD